MRICGFFLWETKVNSYADQLYLSWVFKFGVEFDKINSFVCPTRVGKVMTCNVDFEKQVNLMILLLTLITVCAVSYITILPPSACRCIAPCPVLPIIIFSDGVSTIVVIPLPVIAMVMRLIRAPLLAVLSWSCLVHSAFVGISSSDEGWQLEENIFGVSKSKYFTTVIHIWRGGR